MTRSLAVPLLVGGLVALAACGSSGVTAATPTAPTAEASATKLVAVVRNARQAIGITFDARGRLVYAEKDNGRIIRVSKGRKHVLAKLSTTSGSEDGLLGIAIEKATGNVFASYTSSRSGCPNPTTSSSSDDIEAHCVWRFKPTSSGKLKADGRVFSAGHPSEATNHVGGGIHFDNGGALLYALGDLGENDDDNNGPGRAQSIDVPYGKLLRLDPNSLNKGVADNPGGCNNVANTSLRSGGDERIFACGLRNIWEFAINKNGRIYAAEAGDACDEINLIRSGVNYGWEPPRTDCAGSGQGKPLVKTSGTPSGIDVWEHASAGSWRNDVFYCLYADGGKLVRMDNVTRKRQTIGRAGGRCILDLSAGKRGLYFSDLTTIYRLSRD